MRTSAVQCCNRNRLADSEQTVAGRSYHYQYEIQNKFPKKLKYCKLYQNIHLNAILKYFLCIKINSKN